jgi:hypothetical protein
VEIKFTKNVDGGEWVEVTIFPVDIEEMKQEKIVIKSLKCNGHRSKFSINVIAIIDEVANK